VTDTEHKKPTPEDVYQLLEEGRQLRLAISKLLDQLSLRETPRSILRKTNAIARD